jgi:phage terminase large subunit-like protein
MPVQADAALDFIGCLPNTKGKFAGKSSTSTTSRKDLIQLLCATDDAGRRKLKQFLLGVARKNGKTELIAALALVFLILDGEPGGEVVVAAGKARPGEDSLPRRAKMAKGARTPTGVPFTDFLKITRDEIYYPALDARLYSVSADAQNEQGLNPHVAIVDELHVAAEKNRDLYDALETAMDARENPLFSRSRRPGRFRRDRASTSTRTGKRSKRDSAPIPTSRCDGTKPSRDAISKTRRSGRRRTRRSGSSSTKTTSAPRCAR